MTSRTLLSGTESHSIEIAGRLDPDRARALLPADLLAREDEGGAEIELLAFRMRGLAPNGLSWMGMDYTEILFRLGVEWRGAPAWFVVRGVVDRKVVAASAAALMRYPMMRSRPIDIEPGPSKWRLCARDRGEDTLCATLTLEADTSPAPRPVRPVLVRSRGELFRVPWDETPSPHRRQASSLVEAGALEKEALGAHARWTTAVLHEGRQHRCGVAGRG